MKKGCLVLASVGLLLSACNDAQQKEAQQMAARETALHNHEREGISLTSREELQTPLDDPAVFSSFCERIASGRAFIRPMELVPLTPVGGNLFVSVRSGFIGDEDGVVLEQDAEGRPLVKDRPTLHFYRQVERDTFKVDADLPTLTGLSCPEARGFRISIVPAGRIIVQVLGAEGSASHVLVSSKGTWRPIEELLDESLDLFPSFRAAWNVHVSEDFFSISESDCCGQPPLLSDAMQLECVWDAHLVMIGCERRARVGS